MREAGPGSISSDQIKSVLEKSANNASGSRTCLRGLLLLRGTNVESSKREMKVDGADRGILVPDHDLFGLPGKQASVDRVSIVIWRDADPIPGLEAGVLCLCRPVVCTENLVRVDAVMESPKLAE